MIATDQAPKAIGPYSQAIRAAGLVFTSGQVAIDPATQQVVAGRHRGPDRSRAQEPLGVLQSAGTSLDKALRCTVFSQEHGRLRGHERSLRTLFHCRLRLPVRRSRRRRLAEGCAGRDRCDRAGVKASMERLAEVRSQIAEVRQTRERNHEIKCYIRSGALGLSRGRGCSDRRTTAKKTTRDHSQAGDAPSGWRADEGRRATGPRPRAACNIGTSRSALAQRRTAGSTSKLTTRAGSRPARSSTARWELASRLTS